MPLKKPITRRPIHTRTITISGYSREDGLWDLEANLTDIKAYDLEGLYRKKIPAGEPIHDIRAKIVVDDSLAIVGADIKIAKAPFPMCREVSPSFSGLVGMNLGAGFMREVRQHFGGVLGCTHVAELLGAMATTAFQTIYPVLKRERGEPPGRPALIDSCHAFAADGEVVARQWPAYSTRAAAAEAQGSRT